MRCCRMRSSGSSTPRTSSPTSPPAPPRRCNKITSARRCANRVLATTIQARSCGSQQETTPTGSCVVSGSASMSQKARTYPAVSAFCPWGTARAPRIITVISRSSTLVFVGRRLQRPSSCKQRWRLHGHAPCVCHVALCGNFIRHRMVLGSPLTQSLLTRRGACTPLTSREHWPRFVARRTLSCHATSVRHKGTRNRCPAVLCRLLLVHMKKACLSKHALLRKIIQ
mmetsp:Transcript_37723/g.100372  ORF Transcript_37723/g.100372 Transcript_37723/m.100372 type:complete len:226 (-) Transcript_37723:207-884(-)